VLEKDGEEQLDRSCGKLWSITWNQGGKEGFIHNKTKRSAFVTSWVGTASYKTSVLKERQKVGEDKEDDVDSYYMTLRKTKDTGI
jgi:hypothetical protein